MVKSFRRGALACCALVTLAWPGVSAHADGAVASSASPRPPPMQVDKLDDGLTVVTVPFDSPGIVAYDTLVQAGSRDEVEPGKSGYAHLFEHLMFRGTDTVPAEEYSRRMKDQGAEDHGLTSNDLTLFTTTAPSDALSEIITLNADRFQHLHVAVPQYKDETGAVLGERNKSFADPRAQMDEAMSALVFRTHSYGHTTIGTKHDVEDMPNQYEYSRQFFRRFYTPDDCVIFVVGDFDRAKTLGAIKDAYGPWRGTRARANVKPEPEQKKPRAVSLRWRSPVEPLLTIDYPTPSMKASVADAAALATLIAAVFGGPSELYQRLVVREQKLLELEASPHRVETRDPGTLEITAKLKGATSFDEIIRAVQGALDSAAKGELAPARIEAARSHLLNETILATQTPGQLAERLARLTAGTGDVHALETYTQALTAVRAEDVARVAKGLVPAHRDVVTLETGGEPVPDAKAAAKRTTKPGGTK